jgi:hypothetical protein
MIDLSRRGFFKLTAAASLVVVAAPIITKVVEFKPHLWADGIHDDWEALQWLADRAARLGREFVLRGGSFRVSQTLTIKSGCDFRNVYLQLEGRKGIRMESGHGHGFTFVDCILNRQYHGQYVDGFNVKTSECYNKNIILKYD